MTLSQGSTTDNDLVIAHAIDTIYSTYGDRVSVSAKKKPLFKFGRTANADDGVKTTVAMFQGTVVNETLATTNSVDSIVSDSASDTGIVTVEGHYFDGSNSLVFAVQDATLTGLTAVALNPALCRGSRVVVKDGTFASPSVDLVGNVYVYDATEATGITAGVPDVATATKCMVVAGQNQSAKAATSISGTDYWIITEVFAACERESGPSAAVDVDVETKKLGGVWLPMGLEMDLRTAAIPSFEETIMPARIVASDTDVRLVATADTNNTLVAGHINGYLAKVI